MADSTSAFGPSAVRSRGSGEAPPEGRPREPSRTLGVGGNAAGGTQGCRPWWRKPSRPCWALAASGTCQPRTGHLRQHESPQLCFYSQRMWERAFCVVNKALPAWQPWGKLHVQTSHLLAGPLALASWGTLCLLGWRKGTLDCTRAEHPTCTNERQVGLSNYSFPRKFLAWILWSWCPLKLILSLCKQSDTSLGCIIPKNIFILLRHRSE